MNSSFPKRWSFSYLKFTKYVTNIKGEPKYKYKQQVRPSINPSNLCRHSLVPKRFGAESFRGIKTFGAETSWVILALSHLGRGLFRPNYLLPLPHISPTYNVCGYTVFRLSVIPTSFPLNTLRTN